GNLLDVKKAGSLHEYLLLLHKTYGPVASFMWGTINVVSVADPTLWKELRSLFDRPPELFKLFEPLIGKKSIQYANGVHGRKLRQLFDRGFSHQAVKDYYQSFIEVTEKVANQWVIKSSDEHIPIVESMLMLAIRAIGKAGMGKRFSAEKDVQAFMNAYRTTWEEMEACLNGSLSTKGSKRDQRFQNGN
ncbi:predicted protein, partial [Nematostella vectensis]